MQSFRENEDFIEKVATAAECAVEDLKGMSVSGIPNVYFAYPSSSGGPIEQAVEEDNPRPTSSRPKSRSARPSSKRPSSARKSSRAQDEASKLKSQFLSFDEAQQLEMQVCSEARQLCALFLQLCPNH